MSTENRVRWEERGRYEDLEVLMEDARRLRSQAVCGMIIGMATRLEGVFGRLAAPLAKTIRPTLPNAGKPRLEGSMRTNVSAS